jgi:exonuclease III
MSLNINGDLGLNLLCPNLRRQITSTDIILLQESHLGPNKHDTLDFPDGFQVFSHTRSYNTLFPRYHGGVLTLIADRLAVTQRLDLSSPDIQVLELPNFFLINTYILPEYHKWDSFTNADPFQKLEDTLMLIAPTGKAVFLMGDLNARTGAHSPLNRPGNPPMRVSDDLIVSSRGRALLEICRYLSLSA